RGAAPVVTLEDDVEAHVLPGRELVGPDLGDRVVDDRERAHDLEALRERDHRRAALDALGVLVAHDPRDKHVAVLARAPQDGEVTDVEPGDPAGDGPDARALLLPVHDAPVWGKPDLSGRGWSGELTARDPPGAARGTTWAARGA